MAVSTTKLKKRIEQDSDFFTKAKEGLRPELERLRGQGLSNEAIKKQLKGRLRSQLGTEGSKIFSSAFRAQQGTQEPKQRVDLFKERTVIDPKTGQPELRDVPKDVTDTTGIKDEAIDTTTGAEFGEDVSETGLTLKKRVAQQIADRKTREQGLKDIREEAGRGELFEQQKAFREEAARVTEDIENISKGLEAEGGAITKIAASRIREARSAPLRESLTALVRGQELTSASIRELDQSIDGILEARRLDRQDAANSLANQIESSDISDTEKDRLLTQLGIQTNAAKQRDEIEAFRQKEQIKADMEAKDIESLEKTGLTAEQNLQAATIIQDFDVKEDSLAGQSIRKLLKQGKTPDQIRQILGLAEDASGQIDDVQFTRQEKLRKEFEGNATVKNYVEATQQFAGVISSLGTATGPGDMAAVFQFMKTLDPSSVVRESEFASAAESSGILDRLTSLQILKRAETGQLLTPKQRQQFASIAKVLFENRKAAFDQRAAKFITLAKEAGANPRSVVLDFDNIPGIATDLTSEDLEPISGNSSDEQIIRFINKGGNTFNADSSDSDIGSFLDGDFKTPDQTGLKKDTTSFIKEQEGFSAKAFSDFKQNTSGFGTRALPGETSITEDEANKRLQAKIGQIDTKIIELFGRDLSEGQKTALTSFMFNLGTNIFAKPESQTLKNAIINGDTEIIKQQLVLFNRAGGKVLPGLTARRKRELEQFFINS